VAVEQANAGACATSPGIATRYVYAVAKATFSAQSSKTAIEPRMIFKRLFLIAHTLEGIFLPRCSYRTVIHPLEILAYLILFSGQNA
jgi:hypothetical protein